MSQHHLPVIQNRSSLRADGSRTFVHPADVHGRFVRARYALFALLMVVYATPPWLRVRGRPAVFLDIERRQFFLFGATFTAQDVWLVFFLVTGVGFGLLYLTAVAGRVWCGWACPQTVFLEGIYRRIERLVDGPREQRLRRGRAELTFGTVVRTVVKHALYVLVSLVLAHVFVSYFVSLPRLYAMVRSDPGAHPEAFAWTVAITAALYANFAWFREQLCLGVCPYGRLQGALTDSDSLVVGYDAKRGEPRGKATEKGHGDCVDCGRCVAVCPTGIDIRNGMQLDCVGCTACIDACDEIMDKLARPRGLIRYDSLNGLAGRPRRFLRPRIAVYTGLAVVGLVVATLAFRTHRDFEANVLRLPGLPYEFVDGDVRNAYEIHLSNKRSARTTLLIEPVPMANARFVLPLPSVTLGPLESVDAPIYVLVPRASLRGDLQLQFRVRIAGEAHDEVTTVTAPFLGPAPGTL